MYIVQTKYRTQPRSSVTALDNSVRTIRTQFLSQKVSEAFYRAELFTARCYALERVHVTGCRPSVCLSVTFRYRDHRGWTWTRWKMEIGIGLLRK